jgi:F-type H+-transporting ATPase subunit a
MIGHNYERYTPYLVVLGLFILFGNMLGLVPGMEAPTAVPIVPLGCALVTWFYYQYHGLRAHGPGYIKHFMGPVWWLAPLMLVIEIFSHLARILSLTIRLYANMFAGEQVYLTFLMLTKLIVPVVFIALHLFVAFLQAYIFMLLAMVYVGGAVSHEH